MAFISKEVPVGLVNGVNKVYTLANLVNVIDDVFVDGAIYLGVVTVAGDVITLADAPTASIFVDYWTSPPIPPPPTPFPGLINLTEARQTLLNRKKDLSDVSSTVFIEWCQFVQDFVYRQLKGTDPEQYISTQTIQIASGDTTYALPSDFGQLLTWGTGLFETNPDGTLVDRPLPVQRPGSTLKGYYVHGTNIILTQTPQQSATYILRYTPINDRFTSMSDYFTLDTTSDTQATIPSEYSFYLVNALDVMYTIWDEVPGDEAMADTRFVRCLEELVKNIKKTPAVYNLVDNSVFF